MAELGTLWVGNKITKVQELSFASFVKHGHKLNLFIYDEVGKIPDGVIIRDANEIMPFDNIGRLAHFADVFRFKMVQKYNFGWVDADTLCVTDEWFADNDYYAISESGVVQNGIFRLPQNSDILKYIIEKASAVDRSTCSWNGTNSEVLTDAFDKFVEYKKYLVDYMLVDGIDYREWYMLWDPAYFEHIVSLSKKIKSFSIYNEMLSRSNVDKNSLPEGSAIKFFYDKYVLDSVGK